MSFNLILTASRVPLTSSPPSASHTLFSSIANDNEKKKVEDEKKESKKEEKSMNFVLKRGNVRLTSEFLKCFLDVQFIKLCFCFFF